MLAKADPHLSFEREQQMSDMGSVHAVIVPGLFWPVFVVLIQCSQVEFNQL